MYNNTSDTPEISTVTIPLTKGFSAIIDSVDSDLANFKWHTMVGKHTCYARRTKRIDRRKTAVYIHQIVLARMLERDLIKGEMVDHIDGNGLNNRRSNLRLATNAENQRNAGIRPDNASGFKGVSWHKPSQKWKAQIQINGKNKHLGRYDTPEEAYAAYCEAAKELHGEFARFE